MVRYDQDIGAERLATGHYARTQCVGDAVWLLRALDLHKDQSYVLHRLSQDQLARAAFPNGQHTREQSETLVAEAGLDVSPLPESSASRS